MIYYYSNSFTHRCHVAHVSRRHAILETLLLLLNRFNTTSTACVHQPLFAELPGKSIAIYLRLNDTVTSRIVASSLDHSQLFSDTLAGRGLGRGSWRKCSPDIISVIMVEMFTFSFFHDRVLILTVTTYTACSDN